MTVKQSSAEVDLSVVAVTYRSRGQIADALHSANAAAEACGCSSELIVVDNASDDGTADLVADSFPQATLIRNLTNRGFGSANNQAFAVARGKAWLLMNPDAQLEPTAIGALLKAMGDDRRLAAVGPSIDGAGLGGAQSAGMLPGFRSLAAHFLFLNRLLPKGRGGPWRGFQVVATHASGPQLVEWVSGAVVLLRPEAVRSVGGFDESIFLYGEDTDLCARLGDGGWRIALVPGARALHTIGGSQPEGSTAWLDGLDRYLAHRGTPRWRRRVSFLVVAIGLAIRAAASAISGATHGRRHARRMRSSAVRALRLAIGRPPGQRSAGS